MTERRARKRAALAQNLFRSDAPARRLVALADIRPGDRVYDLGAGTGRVTAALLAAGARVVAVERDPTLATKLAKRFGNADVRVLNHDLTRVEFRAPYKVVANLPFNVTAATLRRLLVEEPPPDGVTLMLQREAARKWAGAPKPTAVSLSLQPWFRFEVLTPFDRCDFVPAPACEVAALLVARRADPMLLAGDRKVWEAFVRRAFARQSSNARGTFRSLLSNLQWRRLSAELGIDPEAQRGDLTLKQWLGVFQFATTRAAPSRRWRWFGR